MKRYGATEREIKAYNLGIVVGFMASPRAKKKDEYADVEVW